MVMMREDIVVICNYICNVFTKTLRNMIGMCIYEEKKQFLPEPC